MSKTEVKEIEKGEFELWDKLVRDSPEGTVFHLTDWITRCSSLLNRKYLLLGFFEDDELRGGCSFYVKSMLKFWNVATLNKSMTPYGGFLLPAHESTKIRERELQNREIISSICDGLSGYPFDCIDLINSPGFEDIRPLTWRGWRTQVYYTYTLPLEAEVSQLVSRNVRRSVRKAQKEGIRIRKNYDPDLYWELNIKTYEKQNLKPPFTKTFLTGMLEMIREKNLGEMWIAETASGEAASAEIIVWDNKRAHRWSAASDPALKETEATSLLLYEIFCDLQMRGFKEVNLMAGNLPQLSMFISGFNPKLVPYYSVRYCKNLNMLQALASSFLRKTGKHI